MGDLVGGESGGPCPAGRTVVTAGLAVGAGGGSGSGTGATNGLS